MNIIANAIDALEIVSKTKTLPELKANPCKIAIETEVSTDYNMVIVRIKDNGPGIPEEIKSHIFDNLFTTKNLGQGTGLGLTISRQIVEKNHSGRLTFNSTLGKGTEFVIKLPISPASTLRHN